MLCPACSVILYERVAFDGFVADMLVQSKINDAKRQVENAIQKVNYIMNQLRQL